MRRPLAAEVAALRPLLSEEWEDEADLIKAIVNALDEALAAKTRYIAVMQYGLEDGACFYAGIGPYSGKASALAAVKRHPGATVADKRVIVPVTSPEGLDDLLKRGV